MNVLSRLMMSLSGKRPAIRIRPSVRDATEADSQLSSAFDAVGGPDSVAAAQHLLAHWEEEDRCRAMARSQIPPDTAPLGSVTNLTSTSAVGHVRIAELTPHKGATYCDDGGMPKRSVSVARSKTEKLQHDIRVAEAELHESNQVLTDTGVGKVATAATVSAAVAQNVAVEEMLHDAVAELAAVSALLKIAEAKNAGADQDNTAGHRSGEGLKSVMDHLKGGARRRNQPEESVRAPVRPSGEATS